MVMLIIIIVTTYSFSPLSIEKKAQQLFKKEQGSGIQNLSLKR